MLKVSSRVSIPFEEIQLQAIRSQGSGGQNVNKVSTAIHLFFDIRASSLPEIYKLRLLNKKDRRISPAGTVIIKSQGARTQANNAGFNAAAKARANSQPCREPDRALFHSRPAAVPDPFLPMVLRVFVQ